MQIIVIIVIIYIKYNHFDCLIITFFTGQIPNHNSQLASQQLPELSQIPTIDLTLKQSSVANGGGGGGIDGSDDKMKEELQIIDVNCENGNKIIGDNDDFNEGGCNKGKMRKIYNEWSSLLALLIIFLMLWAIGYSLLPSFTAPTAPFMRMAFLFVGAQLSGVLITFIKLPDMLGMLFFGVLYTNIGLGDFSAIQGLEAALR